MKTLLVYCHPERKSFNHAMYETALEALKEAGHEVAVSDLYGAHFDPIVSRNGYKSVFNPLEFHPLEEDFFAARNDSFADFLATEMEKVENCDLMIWQFPLWWLGLPARLKGWVERVFTRGRIYTDGCYYNQGLMQGKHVLLSFTTGAPSKAYETGGMQGDLHTLLLPITHCTLEFAGFSVLKPNTVFAPAHMSEDERAQALRLFRKRIMNIASETLPVEEH